MIDAPHWEVIHPHVKRHQHRFLDKDMFVMLTKSKAYKIICMKLKDVLLSE